MTASPPVTQESEVRKIACGNRTYVIRRFADGIFAVYDEAGKLLAGWPLTAVWPNQPITAQTDEDWCALIRRIYGH
ncbi:MAG: hypothetical protein HYY94_06375 [Gemmatimonadetes bacterium]|nr:hypothetical protein [Gemmatimonadota bacterium]